MGGATSSACGRSGPATRRRLAVLGIAKCYLKEAKRFCQSTGRSQLPTRGRIHEQEPPRRTLEFDTFPVSNLKIFALGRLELAPAYLRRFKWLIAFSQRGWLGGHVRETRMRAEGLEPSRAFGSTDFRTVYGFRRPDLFQAAQVCGLDYPFALPLRGLGAARLVSTPSRNDGFSPGSARDYHFRFPRI